MQPKNQNRTEMLLAEPPSTCLSSTVYYMVCEAGFERKSSYALSSIICSTGEINWEFITEHVQYGEQDPTLDYIKSVRSLGPLCESIHLHLKSLTMEQFENQFVVWLQWTNCPEIFLEMFDTVRNPHDAAVALSLMKLTSSLERALGDVFLLIGKDCPFLLRDLLASQELFSIFGQPVMDVLKVFIGCPDGLNLRNILWHGFVSAKEIPVKYFSMLLFLTAGLGQLLNNYCLQTHSALVHRPYVSFTHLKELHIFPAEELVTKSSIVLKTMLPFWITAITSFQQARYADCVILLLPQLEGALRVLFTAVNKCPSRLMTAESSSLYTTFDEILAKQLNNEEMNQLPGVLGESGMEFLWDFLNHQEGPRVRDHLSHGEINLNHFPREIANSMLSFSITLHCRFSQDDLASIKEHEFLKLLMTCANNYCTRFHPIIQLKKQILNCIKSITSWPDFPMEPEEQEVSGSGRDTAPCILMISDILSQLQPYLSVNVTLLGDSLNNLLTEKLLTELCSKHIHTLFSPRIVLETIVVLRQISTHCHHVSCQVISVCETRYKQWINKSLRSRQRLTFLRMKRSIKFLSPVLQLVLILITLELGNIHMICRKNTFECQKYLKFLRLILQYIENLVTYTSPEKNKWDETIVLTHKSLIKIRTFLGRELMLVQLAETKNIVSPHQNSIGLT
ncbi:endoplasmic reticulum membrane-associated RNA degradation protein isoform X3 [Crotalus tigris]|uniref:endoplasmic reticulum membrane-associated RNA degradation protein isoform X3 n=1 Tax=Crotalus tigris TaxID=88082 RepID=UPI00192F83C0|nr:endoplasmic reticulum membrane-associated RNA degradation protein isoform X3 [Crotalus tigris]